MRALNVSFSLALTLVTACEASALGSHEHIPKLRTALEPYELAPVVAPTELALLRWRSPPADCLHAYELRVEYEPDIMHEPDSVSGLLTGPPEKPKADSAPPGADLSQGQTFAGRAYFRGYRAEKRGVFRDWYLSSEHAGPTAPTAACLPRTWDPVEDALALGWPRLTSRLTAVDETWRGLRVEGKCNRSACVIPETGGGGADAHDLACVTMSWRNELAGIYELDGERVALIVSEWNDGQKQVNGVNAGIASKRRVLVSLDHGRPIWAQLVVDHRFAQATAEKTYAPIHRTWTMTSIDRCPGSLASLGWEPTAEARDRLDDLVSHFEAGDDRRSSRKLDPPSDGMTATP